MTLEITLTPEEVVRLRDRAAAARMDVSMFMREAVLEKLDRPTLDELLAPIHEATRRSGMTEDEIDAMIERGRNEVWEERHGKAAS